MLTLQRSWIFQGFKANRARVCEKKNRVISNMLAEMRYGLPMEYSKEQWPISPGVGVHNGFFPKLK